MGKKLTNIGFIVMVVGMVWIVAGSSSVIGALLLVGGFVVAVVGRMA